MPASLLPLQTSVPDDATRAQIRRLADSVQQVDGEPPLSDQARTGLGSGAVEHVLARRPDGSLAGYAQVAGSSAEVVAEPDAIDLLLDTVLDPEVLIWTHGRRSRLVDAVEQRGLRRVRELYRLERPLDDVPADPALPADVTVRPFEVGADDEAWLAVNAAAFAHHPEQGGWSHDDLAAREAEDWFDPAGFLLAERDGELLGFHWTKQHPDGAGEVYVIGVAPAAQGSGLGDALLIRGLRWLRAHGAPRVLLYVDGDNAGARRLYERAGFTTADVDAQWQVTSAM